MAEIAVAVVQTAANLLSSLIETTASVTHIGALPGLILTIPFTIILFGHCLAVAGATKARYSGLHFLSYVQGFLMGFGGSVASNLFLGTPTNNVLFQGNQVVLLWTLAWWIVNYNPIDLVAKFLDLAPVATFCRASLQILRSGLVAAQIDAVAKAYPGIIAPAIIAGTLSGCGGKICTDVISHISGLRAPFEVFQPTYSLKSSLIGSVIHYLTVHVLGALKPIEGRAVVLLLFLSHTLTDDVLGSAYDYTAPVINVFSSVTLIGVKKQGRGRPRTATAAATAAAVAASPASTPRSASKSRGRRGKKGE